MIQSWTILLLATVLAGSTPDNGNPQPVPGAADSTTAFALDLYKELAVDGADGNLCFSPLSISTAIGMLYTGARGETAAQMSCVIRFDPDTATHLHFFRSLVERLPLTTATEEVVASVPKFKFEHSLSLLFLIHDSESDTILFIGRMANPPV